MRTKWCPSRLYSRTSSVLIYIHDIPTSSNVFNFLLYADDTTLFCDLEDIDSDNKELTLNQELQHVHE